jgi:antitoxin (DNA-binding transcriptional repressor) of toxin-antitoxin stability system
VRAVGLKVLKNRLSEYVRLAASGETVLITDRVVAELIPPAPGRGHAVDDAVVAELVRAGCLTPPLLGPGGRVPRSPVARLETILEELDRDRSDR